MPRPRRLTHSLSALALAVAAPAAPALAQVTAAELWAEWQTQSQSFGQTLTAAGSAATGSGLVLSGVTSRYADGEVTIVTDVDQITMTENADGTVSIALTSPYRITLTGDDGMGVPANIGLLLSHEGLSITAGGPVAARNYRYAADSIVLEEGAISGGDGPPPEIDGRITLRDFSGDYTIDGRDPDDLGLQSSFAMASMDGFLNLAPPPDQDGRLKLSLAVGAAQGSGGGNLGNYYDVLENPDVVPENFDLTSDLTYERISVEMRFREDDERFEFAYHNDGGRFATSVSDERLEYNVAATGTSIDVAGSELPVPISATVGSAELVLSLPLTASDTPADFNARIAYQDVEIGEQIWALGDPAQAIPRDPLTVVADISGAVRLFTDLMASDPTAMDAPPGELRSLTVNELRIGAGGAELSGAGDMTFAPNQMIPIPVGRVDLRLSGSNALMDQLGASGLVPMQELAMVRGMIAAFARPGAQPDTMETTVEFAEDGTITANGVPLQ